MVAGTVQATLPAGGPAAGPAEVTRVVIRPAQGRGYATEAARSLVALLHEAGWTVVADIHPGHLASQRVARSAGLSPTADVRDGEICWVGPRLRHHNRRPCAHIAVRICCEGYVRTTVGRFCPGRGRGDVPAQLACAPMSCIGSWRGAIRRRLELSAAGR